jgi:NADP-dependent 3-hydroxy acid dehydrogenase YdfG
MVEGYLMNKKDIQALFDVGGKVSLFIGATGSFGKAGAKGLAAAGVKVMITARTLSALELLAKEISE